MPLSSIVSRRHCLWLSALMAYAALIVGQRMAFRHYVNTLPYGPHRQMVSQVSMSTTVVLMNVPLCAFLVWRWWLASRPQRSHAQLADEAPAKPSPYSTLLRSRPVRLAGWAVTVYLVAGSLLLFAVFYAQSWLPVGLSGALLFGMGLGTYVAVFLVSFTFLNLALRGLRWLLLRCSGGRAALARLSSTPEWLRAVGLDFSAQVALSYALALLFSLVSLASALAIRTPRKDVAVVGLPESLRGFRLAVLSDVHIGPSVSAWQLRRLVAATNALRPDAVALVGDIVDGPYEPLRERAQLLAALNSTHGTFYVTGNHEYYFGNMTELVEGARAAGLRMLLNDAVRLPEGGGPGPRLCLIGTNDVTAAKHGLPSGPMDFPEAAKPCRPGDTTVLLQHNPHALESLMGEAVGVLGRRVDVGVSGHVHGGQMYFLVPVKSAQYRLFHGLYRLPGGSQAFVSAGAHYFAAPMKTWAASEIPLLRLVPSSPPASPASR